MRGEPLSHEQLRRMYITDGQSASSIAKALKCSPNRVNYWLDKYGIQKRSIADAIYLKYNPNGDPFVFTPPKTVEEAFLYGLGLGLYWGEGNKLNPTAVRLGNTDPGLIKQFIRFLRTFYHLPDTKIRFGIQIFSDTNPKDALRYWMKELGFPKSHFGKVIVTPSRSPGSYRRKMEHGVLTVYVSNRNLRNVLVEEIEKNRRMP